jgi:hypothetical protein
VAQTDSSIVEREEEVRSSPGMRDVQELAALVLLLLRWGWEAVEEPMVPVSGVREEVEAEGWVVLRGSSKVLRSAVFVGD